ncbi:hypothetical protein AAFN60_06050 [Roseibacillus persicicus]|uniref:Uncharacterized protein n=1 Tax=Roseibacillus persicicus TaxID=454148 RepID=A0A918TC78_9BACT|nr:hypothetical protein [Roseibacillus persicicus]GHC42298.1 hypothetical protein GCM10007100_04090 [Roseibacillus persicicus]
MADRILVLLILLTFPPQLGAMEGTAFALSKRSTQTHRDYLESRRELFSELSDPFQVASKAKVIEEEPEPWENKRSFWRRGILATIFWVGEQPTPRNPTPNDKSSWDPQWQENFGGIDRPESRNGFLPTGFVPKQTPFYIALPYNDLVPGGGHQPEASEVIPWFWKLHQGPTTSVCHGRWVAIHREGRICYARWRDCGPFSTDDWRYVFLGERPKPNPNGNAGIDISPAVRDYLQLDGNRRVDWKFVEDFEVPDGPWKNWTPTSQ